MGEGREGGGTRTGIKSINKDSSSPEPEVYGPNKKNSSVRVGGRERERGGE